jgi:hypothetical protein
VPTGGIASAWRPLEGSLRVGKRLLPSRSNFSPSPSSSPSLLSRPPPLFLDAHRRALQPLRALHQSSLSIPLSSRVPFSHRQRHGDPLSMVIEICCHGPSGATARTSPRLLTACPLDTIVAATELMLLLKNAKRSDPHSSLRGARSILLLLLRSLQCGNCESSLCVSKCGYCVVLFIVSSGLDVLRSLHV